MQSEYKSDVKVTRMKPGASPISCVVDIYIYIYECIWKLSDFDKTTGGKAWKYPEWFKWVMIFYIVERECEDSSGMHKECYFTPIWKISFQESANSILDTCTINEFL